MRIGGITISCTCEDTLAPSRHTPTLNNWRFLRRLDGVLINRNTLIREFRSHYSVVLVNPEGGQTKRHTTAYKKFYRYHDHATPLRCDRGLSYSILMTESVISSFAFGGLPRLLGAGACGSSPFNLNAFAARRD